MKTPKLLDKLLADGELIRANTPLRDDLAFHHSLLCSIGLPRRPVLSREFLRRAGEGWLHVQAGALDLGDGPVPQPVPYGAVPRLALIWISTIARRSNSREIFIGRSASEFLGMLGLDKQGHRYCTLRRQLHALAACRLQMGFRGRTINEAVIKRIDAWLPAAHSQRATWPGSLVLDAEFFEELVQHSVPLDARALHALRGSALALDVYMWLAHRLHRLNHRPLWLPWHTLKDQFGHEYQGTHGHGDFCTSFKLALRKVLMVYPEARVARQGRPRPRQPLRRLPGELLDVSGERIGKR
ncbi:MAG TPA: replication protein RepA [Ottowia sp.]|nr:replication protein RepA [Ottowia sp.]